MSTHVLKGLLFSVILLSSISDTLITIADAISFADTSIPEVEASVIVKLVDHRSTPVALPGAQDSHSLLDQPYTDRSTVTVAHGASQLLILSELAISDDTVRISHILAIQFAFRSFCKVIDALLITILLDAAYKSVISMGQNVICPIAITNVVAIIFLIR